MIFKRNKTIFNIHIFITFMAFLPLIIMSLAGSIIAYRSELTELIGQWNMDIKKSEEKLKPSEILSLIKEQQGEFTLRSFNVYKDDMAYQVTIQKSNKRDGYMINPYTGEMKKDMGMEIMGAFVSLHRNLGLGLSNNKILKSIGKNIVGFTAIMMILLIITGIWLYYPLIKKSPIKSLKFNTKVKGYGFFYQLHATLGLWLSALLLTMSITGIYWSYSPIKNFINSTFGVEKVEIKNEQKESQNLDFSGYDVALSAIDFKFDKLSISQNKEKYAITYYQNGKKFSGDAVMENGKAKFIPKHVNSEEKMTSKEVSQFILSIHQGSFFGEIGRAFFCISCFMINLLIISGFIMMLKRINRVKS